MQHLCIIIPCYNEAQRFDPEAFRAFLAVDQEVCFCFANDGSRDNTLEILQAFCQENPERLRVLDLSPNGGKAEAIRRAAPLCLEWKPFTLLGYFDCDLSAPLSEIANLQRELERNPGFRIVYGARMGLMGRNIHRKMIRHYLGRIFATLASMLLRMPIYDTQCGAKMFHASLVPVMFSKPFITRWFFDVEMLFRLRRVQGDALARSMVAEAPLYEWVEKKGSKLKFMDFLTVPFQLLRIAFHYRRYTP